MPAFAAVTLSDRTPADVVFNPNSIDAAGVASLMTGGSVFDARTRLTQSVRLPKTGGNVSRVVVKITLPVMDTVDTSKKVADALCNIEFVLPKQSTDAHRGDLLAFAKSYLAHANMTAAVVNVESVY